MVALLHSEPILFWLFDGNCHPRKEPLVKTFLDKSEPPGTNLDAMVQIQGGTGQRRKCLVLPPESPSFSTVNVSSNLQRRDNRACSPLIKTYSQWCLPVKWRWGLEIRLRTTCLCLVPSGSSLLSILLTRRRNKLLSSQELCLLPLLEPAKPSPKCRPVCFLTGEKGGSILTYRRRR